MDSSQATSEEGTQYKKFTRHVIKNLIKKEKACARHIFLKKCYESKVIPNTLVIKPPNTGGTVNPDTQNKYKICASTASLTNLRIAIKDASKEAHEQCSLYKELLSGTLESIPPPERDSLLEHVRKREPQISRKLKHSFHQKLKHLKEKQNQPCEKPNPDGYKAPTKTSKNRRFMKRNKYRKWKKREAQKKVNLITNLSDFTLNEDMTNLLNRGLSFVPCPKGVNKSQLVADLSRYERNMKWKEYFFQDEPQESNDNSEEETGPKDLFKQKKSNLPPTKAPPALRDYLSAVRSDILGSIKKGVHSNISKEEAIAIKELQTAQKEGQIVIKPSDKGGGVTIMNKNDYVEALEKQLKSTHTNEDGTSCPFYVKSNEQEIKEFQSQTSSLITEGVRKGYISKNDGKYMDPSDKPGRLYGLCKTHKEVKQGEKLPPIRPIVSNSGATTEQISSFVDTHARSQVLKMKSFVEDTPHLLRLFETMNAEGPQTEGTFPVSIDVKNMYGNIPSEGPQGGLAAFEFAMNKREDQSIPTVFLVALMSIILRGNIFEFASQLWRQIIGCAMGTKSGPTYANLFMDWLEQEKLLGLWTGTQPKNWKRYLDDILFFWSSTEEELLKFLDHLNAQHPYIKFTMEYNIETKSVPFLDTIVSINESGYIETDLFRKTTAKVQYLLPSSCHPSFLTKNIPYSLAYRLLRICSKPEVFQQRLLELKDDLISRSYHIKVIEQAFERIKGISRSEALKRVDHKKDTGREPLVVTFHPNMPPLHKLIKKHHNVMINEDMRLQRCFKEPSIVAFKRSQNLRDLLVRARVSKGKRSSRVVNGFKRCERICEMCIRSHNNVKEHTCERTGQSWQISAPITCLTKNIVYRLTCKKCPQSEFVYIGQTERRACDRFADHRGYVTQGKINQPAGEHFTKKGHTTMDMLYLPIERVLPRGDTALRESREKIWISRYDSTTYGKNTRA